MNLKVESPGRHRDDPDRNTPEYIARAAAAILPNNLGALYSTMVPTQPTPSDRLDTVKLSAQLLELLGKLSGKSRKLFDKIAAATDPAESSSAEQKLPIFVQEHNRGGNRVMYFNKMMRQPDGVFDLLSVSIGNKALPGTENHPTSPSKTTLNIYLTCGLKDGEPLDHLVSSGEVLIARDSHAPEDDSVLAEAYRALAKVMSESRDSITGENFDGCEGQQYALAIYLDLEPHPDGGTTACKAKFSINLGLDDMVTFDIKEGAKGGPCYLTRPGAVEGFPGLAPVRAYPPPDGIQPVGIASFRLIRLAEDLIDGLHAKLG
jgi:hypothetical protein